MLMGGIWCMSGTVVAQQAADSVSVEAQYDEGVRQKEAGQLAAAEQTFGEVIRRQPDNDRAYFQLALIQTGKKELAAAAQNALRAAELKPDNQAYWSMVLDIYRETRNVKAIPVVLDELIRLNPADAALYHEKAYALFLDKQYDAALAACDTIGSRFGVTDDLHFTKHQIYLAQGNTDAAVSELTAVIAGGTDDPKAYILLSGVYNETGETKEALALLDQAEDRFPGQPLVLLSKSDTYLAMGKQRQAYNCLQQAFGDDNLELDAKAGILYNAVSNKRRPLDPEYVALLADQFAAAYPAEAKAHAVRGDVYMQLQRPEEARGAYLEALDINRNVEGLWQQLMQAELQLGRYDDVETHGKEALGIFPNQPLILFFTGHGYLANQRYKEARASLETALNNADAGNVPLMTQLYSSLGDVYHAMDMYAESDVAYGEAIALDSTNAYALNNYAYYLALRKQKLPLAAEMSKRSNELEPDSPSYQDTYAWVLFQQGDYHTALEWIEKAIGNSDEVSETLLEHHGDILAKLGHIGKAVSQWKKARDLSRSIGKDIDKLSQKIDAKQYID